MADNNSLPNSSTAQHLASAVQEATAQTTQQETTAGGVQTTGTPPVSAADTQRCLWEGCSERFNGPEALYEHICDRHVGRKSTNNLNLECRWANCKTKTVKRDHITSHVRVHVPHKPHRCPICNKSFKRPQDLKKHHKTHAEDSGPPNSSHNGQGPNGHQGGPPGHNGYGGMGGAPGPGPFYPQMQGGVGMNFGGYQGPGYYGQPPHQNMGANYNGAVYYNHVGDGGPGTQATYGRHDGALALDSLLETIKQPSFDPSNYDQIGPALMQMHGVALPQRISSHGIEYDAPRADNTFAQSMSQLPHIRHKEHLMAFEKTLQKMRNTLETQDSNVPSAQMQPGGNTAGYPSAHMRHAHQAGSDQTPALTPGSSAMSYSPGNSPSSDHSSMASPGAAGVPAYPHLQSTAAMAVSGQTMSVPLLGNQYDLNDQQRRTGGRLTRAAPSDANSTTTSSRPSNTKRSVKAKREQDANIDPALTGPPSTSSSGSDETTTPTAESGEEPGWLQDVRIIDDVLKLLKEMRESHLYEGESSDASEGGSAGARSNGSDEMEDVKHEISYPELSSLAN